jgi:hypothetical protein
MPEKLADMQRQSLIEATRYNVLPLNDDRGSRMIPALAGRPTLIEGDTQILFPGMAMGENNVVDIKNKSTSVTANVTIPERGADGVIVAQGANFLGLDLYEVETEDALPAGDHQVRMEFAYATTFAADRRRWSATSSAPRSVPI